MRILWVVYGSLERLSGGYLYDRLVVEYLRAHGSEVEVLGIAQPPYLLCPLQAPRLRSLDGFDAIVVDELTHPSLFRWAVARARARAGAPSRRPRLVTLVHHLRCREPLPRPWKAFARAMERRLVAASDAVIANSRATAAAVEELAGTPPLLVVCPPGCDRLPAMEAGPAPAAGETDRGLVGPLRDGAVRLLATGNLIPRKGYDLLLELLSGLTDLPWELRVTGRPVDRRYERRLRALVHRGGLSGRVTFTGELGEERLAWEYRRAQVFVFPSRYEGYGISLAEAVRAGLPFVAFAGEAIAEAVRGRGLLVAPGDLAGFGAQLRRLLTDASFRERQAALSRELAPTLPRWQDTGRLFLAALQQACG
jgi:glycosyltransferase involved in cell wall biosynthesis